MSIDGFPFEGRDVTARQLKRAMPAYGEATLQSALEAGCADTATVIAYCERRIAAGRYSSGKTGRAAWRRAHGQ